MCVEGRGGELFDEGLYGNSLYFPLNVSGNLNLLLKIAY